MAIGIVKDINANGLVWSRPIRSGMDWNKVSDFQFPDRSGRIVSLRGIGGGFADNSHPNAQRCARDIYRWLSA